MNPAASLGSGVAVFDKSKVANTVHCRCGVLGSQVQVGK
jgi:hypothetical protein